MNMSRVDATEIENTARAMLRLHAVDQPVILAAFNGERLAIWIGYEVLANDASGRDKGELVMLGVLEIIEYPYAHDADGGWTNRRAGLWLMDMSPAGSRLSDYKTKGSDGALRMIKLVTFREGLNYIDPRVWVTWPDNTRTDGVLAVVKRERSW